MSLRQFPPLKFCFIPFYGAPSHSYSLTNIARYFAFRGQKITILATQYNYQFIQNLVRYDKNGDGDGGDDDRHVVNGDGNKIDVRMVSMPFEKLGLTKEEESLITPYKLYFVNELLRQSYEEILTKDDERFDCVVADFVFGWTADFASRLRIPCVVSFNPYSVLYACIKEVLRNNNHNNNQVYQSESFVVPGLPVDITMTKSELPPEEFCWVEEQLREGEMKCDFVLVNNFKELESENVEFFSKVTGRKVFAIGPSSEIDSKIGAKIGGGLKITEDDEHYCLKWLDKKDPESVLYVCFGSIYEFSDAQMVEIASALESSGHNFILVPTRRENMVEEGKGLPIGFFERIKNKGLVLKNWAPQLSILNHPSLGGFMTHCGWNSILEGISAGVPMITWPLTCDQFCNEKLVTQGLGIGLPVGRNEWLYWLELEKNLKGREEIEFVVRKLMDFDDDKIVEMRNKAREYGKMAKRALDVDDDNGGSTHKAAMDLIEEVRIKVENYTKK